LKQRSFRGLWIITIIAFLLVVVILILGNQSFKATERAAFGEFNQRQLVLARGAARGIELYFDTLAGDLRALGRMPEIQHLDEARTRREIGHTFDKLEPVGVNDIGVLDADGVLRYNVAAPQIEGTDFSWRRYYQEASEMTSSDAYVVEFIEFKGVEAGQKGVLVASPLFETVSEGNTSSPADQFPGMILCTLRLDTITQRFVVPVQSSERGHAFLVDGEYDVLWAPDRSLFGENLLEESEGFPTLQRIVERMSAGNSGTAEYSYYRFEEFSGEYSRDKKEEKLMAYAPVRLGNEVWAVGVWAPKEDARQLIRSVYLRQMFVVGLSILITIVGASYTVVRLKASYDQVAEEQSKVLAAIESSRDAIWVSDADRRVVMANSAMEELTGQGKDELLGQSCHDLLSMSSSNGASICETACPILQSASDNGRVEVHLSTPSGRQIWSEISYGRVTDTEDHLTGVVHIVHDLTKRKEIERLKDEFISMVSHELRSPLNHIKGFATTLLQTDVEWEEAAQHDFLGSINREADRLADLVGKILHLSRLEADGLPMEKEWYQVVDLANGALRRRRDLVTDRQVSLCLSPDLPALFVDGREIEVVIVNLLENAVKYSNSGTPITLGVERQNDQVVFSVADQGIGIPPEHRERIFERFYRVDSDGHRGAGTGLGLAICQRIVEAHGGRIWVESTPEVGSCFYFSLPLEGVSST
jgi:two-component system phosphate regulon sensor histidine kinase PhoR